MGNFIDDFARMSQYAGMREDIVQAGGGNSSVKLDGERMLIKASGFQLAEVSPESGYAEVNYRAIAEALAENLGIPLPQEAEAELLSQTLLRGKRPSIETFLHAVTDVFTLHTHPIVVNILAARQGGMELLGSLFPDALLVSYDTPGIRLAQTYYAAVHDRLNTDGGDCQVIFLENHGLIVTGKTAEAVIACHEAVLSKLEEFLGLDMTVQHNATALWTLFMRSGEDGIIWTVTDANVLRVYRDLGGLWEHAFCPDCLVYCGKRMLRLEDGEDIEAAIRRHLETYGPISVIEWHGALYIHAPTVRKALEIQSVLSFSAQVMWNNRGAACSFLPDAEQDFLLHWDA